MLETDSIKEFVAYAKGQGSQHAERYYYSFTALANKAAGITSGRDGANVQQLATLSLIEHIITEVIQCDMRQEKPYKAIYLDCKARIAQFREVAYLTKMPLQIRYSDRDKRPQNISKQAKLKSRTSLIL